MIAVRPDELESYLTQRIGDVIAYVAISNHRLVFLADGQVTFRWRDSAHKNKKRLMTLPVEEFLRRFLLHLLPRGFVRIRNFVFLANRRGALSLPLCTHLLSSANQSKPVLSLAARPVRALTFWICPMSSGPMHVIERLTAAQIQLRLRRFHGSMRHETTSPASIHPRASTRTRLLCLPGISPSFFARGESCSQAAPPTKTRCRL